MSNLTSLSILFIPCWWDGLSRDSGSARIRAEWVCRYWNGAEVYDRSQRFAGHDLYVFQKAYLTGTTRKWIRAAARWRDEGKCRLAFDLCDPDFLESEHKRRMMALLPLFDFAVASTSPIHDWLVQWLPTYVIPDRVDLAETAGMKHNLFVDVADASHIKRDEPRLVWAGYERNVEALEPMLPAIRELGLDLAVIAVDKPKPFEEFWQEVLQYDVLLNPRPDRPPFSYKSDNKTLIAWSLGLCVARTVEELHGLLRPSDRYVERERRSREMLNEWDVRLSVEEWQQAFDNKVEERRKYNGKV